MSKYSTRSRLEHLIATIQGLLLGGWLILSRRVSPCGDVLQVLFILSEPELGLIRDRDIRQHQESLDGELSGDVGETGKVHAKKDPRLSHIQRWKHQILKFHLLLSISNFFQSIIMLNTSNEFTGKFLSQKKYMYCHGMVI